MKKIFILIIIAFQISSSAQINGKKMSVFVGGDYITSAQIFHNPNSSDVIIRNESFEITDLFSPAIDFRYFIYDEMLIGLSSEYIKGSDLTYIDLAEKGSGRFYKFQIEDGVIYVPVELSIHYLMPFSTEDFSFTMGGGLGYYFASQTRRLGDNEIVNTANENTFGLHVSIGMEYRVYNDFGVRLDMKFRDPENKVTSHYKNTNFTYDGKPYIIESSESTNKLNLNGISFLLGLTYHF